MLSIKNIEDFIFEYRWYKRNTFKNNDDTFDLYVKLIKTIVLIPICLIVDIILIPFAIGYLIFKKLVSKEIK